MLGVIIMNCDVIEKFEVINMEVLSAINGGGYGAQCVIGTAGAIILGTAGFGPWGGAVGLVSGSTAFCHNKVS